MNKILGSCMILLIILVGYSKEGICQDSDKRSQFLRYASAKMISDNGKLEVKYRGREDSAIQWMFLVYM